MRKIAMGDLELPDRSAIRPDRITEFTVSDIKLQNIIAGGGVEALKADEVTPIRLTGIKGQLRFWWRTMREEKDYTSLLAKETELWGGISPKETASIFLLSVSNLKEKKFDAIKNQKKEYIFFPWKGKGDLKAFCDGRFDLQIRCKHPDQMEEIRNTVGLWLLFGGVGARTRRGAGALNAEQWLAEWGVSDDASMVKKLQFLSQKKGFTAKWPVLYGSRIWLRRFDEHENLEKKAWENLIQKYQRFRQMRTGNPGRSKWPEPNAIRILTGQYNPKHRPLKDSELWFPRAAYGLPIVFHFKDQGEPNSKLEVSEKEDRWASPVILKAIKLKGGVYQVALLLNSSPPETLWLDKKEEPVPNLPKNLDRKSFPDADISKTYEPLEKDEENLPPLDALLFNGLKAKADEIHLIGGES